MIDYGLKGKFALITGGSHGIGLETSIALAKEGVNIAVFSRSEKNINNTQKIPYLNNSVALDKINAEYRT